MGTLFKLVAIHSRGLADAGGLRMTIAYRTGTAADLPAIDALFRASFADTFAHLYKPEDLAAFFANFTPAAWAEEMADERYAFRLAEDDGQLVGFVKLGSAERSGREPRRPARAAPDLPRQKMAWREALRSN